MARGRRLDPEIETRICKMVREGATDPAIAASTGLGVETIASVRTRNGLARNSARLGPVELVSQPEPSPPMRWSDYLALKAERVAA